MAFFQYRVKDKNGKLVQGKLEADSQERALEYLRNQESLVLYLAPLAKRKVHLGKVKTDDLVIFSRQLTTLIESGIPVVTAFDVLSEQAKNSYFKQVILAIKKDLQEGLSLANAITKFPNVFSELYISMVNVAESSGNIGEILDRVSLYLEKTNALRKKIISSLTYPIVVVCMAIAITTFLVFKIIPTFKDIFSSLGGTLPLPTQIVINLSNFFKNNLLFIFIGSIFLSILFKKYISTPVGKKQFHGVLLKTPIIGDILLKVSIAQFSRTFSTLVRSGVPIVTSLEIVGKTSGNKIVEEAVDRARKFVQQGVSISKPLEESKIFPPMVVKMIAVGEQSGKLEVMLVKIAQFYEEQVETVINSLSSLIEPIIIGFLGIIIGGIVIALFLPIIQITQLVGK